MKHWNSLKKPLEDLMEEVKINFSKVAPCPFFVVKVLVFQVIDVNCVRLAGLLLAKLNLLCLEMLVGTFFWSSTNSELNFCKIRNLLLKILDPPLYYAIPRSPKGLSRRYLAVKQLLQHTSKAVLMLGHTPFINHD